MKTTVARRQEMSLNGYAATREEVLDLLYDLDEALARVRFVESQLISKERQRIEYRDDMTMALARVERAERERDTGGGACARCGASGMMPVCGPCARDVFEVDKLTTENTRLRERVEAVAAEECRNKVLARQGKFRMPEPKCGTCEPCKALALLADLDKTPGAGPREPAESCKACATRTKRGFEGQCPACANERTRAELRASRAPDGPGEARTTSEDPVLAPMTLRDLQDNIEAASKRTRAELVREIVAWLREPETAIGWAERQPMTLADIVEKKWETA